MSYHVKLEIFEGPLDLLLYFIKRDEINIYDIPIAHITREYMEYLQLMQSLNLHVAGEFILMAAMLMRIKAQMLLPKPEEEEEVEVEDPRTELVQMLVEYQKYKAASQFLSEMEDAQSRHYPVNIETLESEKDLDLFLSNVTLYELGLIFAKLMQALPKEKYIEMERVKVTISEQIQFIRSLFYKRQRIRFSELKKHLQNRVEIVVTFLAILEMIKMNELSISQKSLFEDFWLIRQNKMMENVIPAA